MSTHWAKHADAIEDAREGRDTALVGQAMLWALSTAQPEATELYAAAAGVFYGRGECGADARNANRALEIVLDAYLEHRHGRAAA